MYSQDSHLIPRPYIFGGADLASAGYQTIAPWGGVGVQINSKNFLLDGAFSYENSRKVNDATGSNPKGHERYLGGSAYYRLPSQWYFGGGASWGQTATTNYTKTVVHPSFGGGRDFNTVNCPTEGCSHDFTARLAVDYILNGTDWQNGVHGPKIAVYLPSPTAKRHVFYRQTFSIYRFHDTVTAPSDPYLTRQECGVNHFFETMEAAVIFRF
jgi:hypothetical protein